jgi:hypothetical protein
MMSEIFGRFQVKMKANQERLDTRMEGIQEEMKANEGKIEGEVEACQENIGGGELKAAKKK